jgi:hypothetical protein
MFAYNRARAVSTRGCHLSVMEPFHTDSTVGILSTTPAQSLSQIHVRGKVAIGLKVLDSSTRVSRESECDVGRSGRVRDA